MITVGMLASGTGSQAGWVHCLAVTAGHSL